MAYKISWSDIALEDYHRIIDYLIDSWSLAVAIDFEKMVNRKLPIYQSSRLPELNRIEILL